MNQFVENSLVCTCGNDLIRNGGQIHNYACPFTPKCQHPVLRINIQTGEYEHGPCGSRLEPEYACHGNGCPLVQLCPHCGTRMDQRGVHNHDCPNNSYVRDRLIDPENHNYFERILRFYYEIILPKPLPSINDGIFDVLDECSICLSKFENSEVVMKPSECQHCFHDNCIMQWIKSSNKNNRKCPFCREKIETIEKQVFQDGK
jgi:hypothetical protein